MPDALRVAAFPSAGELALHAADDRGMLTAAGLRVEISWVPGSRQQFAGLREGRWDVLHTAIDNVLAYRADGVDAIAVAGVNRGLLSLVALPGVELADLQHRPIGVDSAASGYAVVLRHALRHAGVDPAFCEIVEVGGTRERAEALAAGSIAATLLTPPYDVAARHRGCRVLLRPTDVVPRYVGATVTVLRPWAEANGETLRAYLGALGAAQRWVRDDAHRDEVQRLVADRMGVDPELAPDVVTAVLDPAAGLLPGGVVEPADVESVLDVRRRDNRPVDVAADEALDPRYLPSPA